MDIVCNNWDRLPIMWNNEGNFRNIMLHHNPDTEDDWEVVGIDNGFFPINKEVAAISYANYMKRVEEYMTAIAQHPDQEAEDTKKMRECLYLSTQWQIGEEASIEIQHGIVEQARMFAGWSMEDLETLKRHVQDMIHQDWANVWHDGVKAINVEMMYDVLLTFRRALSIEQ